eukprot:CAMPEP_0118869598 /NCGR_PEP_ID=MMETSP1163-20130328/12885_1 /TAXON_ID=124430 /ORGANISM="Phaeomonas parva, Strain CCMP2877" /LENGTH=489 /DNA_ID=CAMNT_0006804507 /DNA_START=245 /DNA_END=1710 /DNA_ORIENTATION=-
MPKKKGKKDDAPTGPPVDPVDLLYTSVISDAEEEIKHHQMQKMIELRRLREELLKQESMQAEAYNYLQRKLADNYESIDRLERCIMAQQIICDKGQAKHNEAIRRLDAKYKEPFDMLSAEKARLHGQVSEMRAFMHQEEMIQASLQELERRVEAERVAIETQAKKIEDRDAYERERMEEEQQDSVREAEEKIVAEAKEQLGTEVKSWLRENEQMRKEMAFQEKESASLKERNDAIEKANEELERQLAEARERQQDYAENLAVAQRFIAKIKHKIKKRRRASESPIDAAASTGGSSRGPRRKRPPPVADAKFGVQADLRSCGTRMKLLVERVQRKQAYQRHTTRFLARALSQMVSQASQKAFADGTFEAADRAALEAFCDITGEVLGRLRGLRILDNEELCERYGIVDKDEPPVDDETWNSQKAAAMASTGIRAFDLWRETAMEKSILAQSVKARSVATQTKLRIPASRGSPAASSLASPQRPGGRAGGG